MANGPTQSGKFSDPGLTDVQWQLLDSLGNALTALAPPDRNGGSGNYLVTPVYPAGYQYGFIRWASATAGLDYTDVCNLDAPVPYPAYAPATPPANAEAYSTDVNGYLTLYLSIAGATDALTLTDGNGTTYDLTGQGVSTTLNYPLDPGAMPGDPDSPGEVVAWTWNLSALPPGLYTGTAAATGIRVLAVTVTGYATGQDPATLYEILNLTPSVIAAVSVEYIRVQVAAEINGLPQDPTSLPGYIAFVDTVLEPYEPVSADFSVAQWEQYQGAPEINGPVSYFLHRLAGFGISTFLAGHDYSVWVKIVDGGETFIKFAGMFSVR
jgi:hypothetical protein